MISRYHPVLAVISNCYSEPEGRFPRVTYPCATRSEDLVRLACVRHAASVRSEPESNSQVCARPQCPKGKTSKQPRPASRSRSCTSHILWICNETCRAHPHQENPAHANPKERLDFERSSGALKPPETASRRPHVPSSKPTMSKNHAPPSHFHGQPDYRSSRDASGDGQLPCPAGERPYMEGNSRRQWLFSAPFPKPGTGRTRRKRRTAPQPRARAAGSPRPARASRFADFKEWPATMRSAWLRAADLIHVGTPQSGRNPSNRLFANRASALPAVLANRADPGPRPGARPPAAQALWI